MSMQNRRTPKGSYGLDSIWEESKNLPVLGVGGQLLQLYFRAWHGLFSSPLTSLLTIFTLGLSLSILGAFVLFVENARGLLSLSDRALTVHLYLKEDAHDDATTALRKDIERYQGVERVRFISKEEALQEFKKTLGEYSSLVEGVEGANPLPASFEISFAEDQVHDGLLSEFKRKFAQNISVEVIQYSEGAISQVVSAVRFLRNAGIFTVLALCIATGFIIASTIMLALYAHRDEIRIMRLVGAREWTVRTPYVVEGFIKGVLGGALSIGVLYGLFQIMQSRFSASTLFAYFIPEFHFLSISGVVLVILIGLSVGIVGSYCAVRRSVVRG